MNNKFSGIISYRYEDGVLVSCIVTDFVKRAQEDKLNQEELEKKYREKLHPKCLECSNLAYVCRGLDTGINNCEAYEYDPNAIKRLDKLE